MTLQENISLLPHNTFGIDANCHYFVEYDNVAELQEVLTTKLLQNNRLLHIGSGSNLLFVSDFEGVILHSNIKGIDILEETENEVFIRVGAGEVWDDVVAYAVAHNYGGIENLSLIPGEVGASAVQNIGAYGVEAKDVISSVETIEIATGLPKVFMNIDCQFAYRESIFKKEAKNKYIVTHVVFCLQKNPAFNLEYGNIAAQIKGDINLQNIRSTIIQIREEKLPDPKVLGNAGSFFMNPIIALAQYEKLKEKYTNIPHYPVSDSQVKVPAGWLIDQCGWKGRSVGNAAVHEQQALVIVNKGGATAQEIISLSNQISASVKVTFDIDIFPEVNMIG
jgi:UDP-N-acetylmuramate dehydrogenase